MMTLSVQDIVKKYQQRSVLPGISFRVEQGGSVAVTGPNGSGKSTLVKIIAGALSPSSGGIMLEDNGIMVPREKYFRLIGFVAPYLQLYDEFSALENLFFASTFRGLKPREQEALDLLRMVNLYARRHDDVRTFSSGMKQRLKYAFALVHKPRLLILDEPTSNLDEEGVETVHTIIRDHREGGILIIATNEKDDLRFADEVVSLRKGGSI
jgi:heme exporter protein A